MDGQELSRAEAEICLAKKLGFIDEAGFAALEERRIKKNKEIQEELNACKTVYGLTCYSSAAYLQYELTRFRLDFCGGKGRKSYIQGDNSRRKEAVL